MKQEDLTLDHVVPKSANGKTTNKNLKICCKKCNQAKGSLPLDVYLKQKERE